MIEFPEYDLLPSNKRMLFDEMYEEAYVSLVKSLKIDNDAVAASARKIAVWNFMKAEKAEVEAKRRKALPVWDTRMPLKIACEE